MPRGKNFYGSKFLDKDPEDLPRFPVDDARQDGFP
jgi:hypothetical protein